MSDTSTFEIPPGTENDDLGPSFRAYSIFLIVLTVASITLRFISRSLLSKSVERRRRFWWDDWVALLCVPFILVQQSLSLVLVDLGVGRHIWAVPPEDIPRILKLLYIAYLFYGFSLTVTKSATLVFFSRVFPSYTVSRWWIRAIWVTHALNIAWLLGYTFVIIFQCKPIAFFWDMSLGGTCVRQINIYIGSSVPSVIIDLIILILPVPMLLHLQTSKARKAGIILIFVLGYGVVVVSVGRMVTSLVIQDKLEQDLTYEGVSSFWWGVLEAPITLFGVCLPAMLTLGRRVNQHIFSPLASKLSSALGSSFSRTRSSSEGGSGGFSKGSFGSSSNGKRPGPYTVGLGSMDVLDPGSESQVSGLSRPSRTYNARVHAGSDTANDSDEIPPQAIRVQNGVTITHQV